MQIRTPSLSNRVSKVTSEIAAINVKAVTSIQDGLAGYWPFDETAGSVAADTSGRANHGTVFNSLGDEGQWATGKIGGALNFRGPGLGDDFVDVDEWLRVLAFQSLVGPGDADYTGGTYHNYRLYRRPADGRVLYLPWDWDSCFSNPSNSPLVGSGNVTRLMGPVDFYRRYLGHLYGLISTGFNRTYLAPWAAHFGAVSGQDFGGVLDYVEARAAFVLARLPTATPFAITNNGGNNFTVTNGWLALGGTAPIAVNQIEVNGQCYPVSWTSTTQWAVTVPLLAGGNPLMVRGLDPRGAPIDQAVDFVIAVNEGPPAFAPVVINEWMADIQGPGGVPDPADGVFQDWFELYNPNPQTVVLSGLQLTDNLSRPAKWTIPTNVFIGPRGYLLVWADGDAYQNPPLGGTNVDLHANFQLSNGGEVIGLFAADGVTPISTVTFACQAPNVSEGRFPDGDTSAVHGMPDWTPRAPNALGALPAPQLLAVTCNADRVTLVWQAIPGRLYQLERTGDLAEPMWTPLVPAQRANADTASASDGLSADVTNRFYRVLLLP